MSDIESRKIKIKNMIIELLENEKLNDREQEGLLFKIKKLSPDPEISDYIFWDKGEFWEGDKIKIDAIIEKAFAYKPIILGDQSQKITSMFLRVLEDERRKKKAFAEVHIDISAF